MLLVLALAAGAFALLREDTYEADPDAPSAAGPQPALAAGALERLEAALRSGDPRAAAETAASGDPAAADRLAGVARAARRLELTDVSMRYLSEAGATSGRGAWPATVELTWRIPTVDRSVARTEIQVGFAAADSAVGITGLGGGEGRSPVWLDGTARVERVGESAVLVVADASPERRRAYAELVRRAVPAVRSALPGWDGGVAVEVPATADGVDAVLGEPPGTYARIAAVTGSADGSTGPRAPVRVVVNPDQMDALGRVGQQVVMTHEVAHVASGAATSQRRAPAWLVEGFADVVALRDVDLPLSRTAGQVAAQVRRSGLPDALPDDAQFDTVTGPHLGAAYESAWLAAEVVADRAGLDGLAAAYRAADTGVPLDRALRRHAGITEAELVRQWRARLAEVARRTDGAS